MPDMTLTERGAAQIARDIACGEVSSREVVQAHIDRILEVDRLLNAVVVRRFELALDEAAAADEAQQRGETLGPLHGVPVTVKECFHLQGTPSCIGLTRHQNDLLKEDGLPVRLLRDAGAIVMGKTNVPLLMLSHGCDNPVYGRTNNPWDPCRTSGGSTGGEAAIIAAGGSPLGLGSDLGGSIRIPCHACGIHGIKPTDGRLARSGMAVNLRGMETIMFQPGPMARHVEDLWLALRVLADPAVPIRDPDVLPAHLNDPSTVSLEGLRVAMWWDDGFFRVSPAIRRAVEAAGEILRRLGAEVEPVQPPQIQEAMRLYYGILSADGGADARRLLRGSQLNPPFRRLLRIASLPRQVRRSLSGTLRLAGQHRLADLLTHARRKTADEYWQLTHLRAEFKRRFLAFLERLRYDAWICPPHALPAMTHEEATELIPAASYSFLANVLGVPCGVVAATRVGADEETDRPANRDRLERRARAVERQSAGLPVGVQVVARHWREDIVLAVMAALEREFAQREDYPIGSLQIVDSDVGTHGS